MSEKRGRKKEYRNAAEKQKAYRARKKAQEAEIEEALSLLGMVKDMEEALRKTVELWEKKGKEVRLHHVLSPRRDYEHLRLYIAGQFRGDLNVLLFYHLHRHDQLERVGKNLGDVVYRLLPGETKTAPGKGRDSEMSG